MQEIDQDRIARFNQLLKKLKVSQLLLSQKVGVSTSFINKVVQGQKDLSRRVIDGISKSYPKVNIAWLLTGQGEMTNEKQPAGVSEITEASQGIRRAKGSEAVLDAFKTLVEGYEQRISDLESRVKRLETRADYETKKPT